MIVTKNNITMEYTGAGNGSVSVTSSVNEGLDYSTTFTVSTTDKSISKDIVVNKEGKREIYNEDFILSDGDSFNVIKEKYKDE